MDTNSVLLCSAVTEDVRASIDDAAFVAEIRAGVAAEDVFVVYQPIVDLESGQLRKVEALARWNHPVHGAISPDEFIRSAERTGSIADLGEWILERVCRDVVAMRERGIDIDVNVNYSAAQLHHPSVVERTAAILARTGLAPDRLWIEVTESVFLTDAGLDPLCQLHELGVRLVIDDFGTGFSNLQYLSRLPIDGLKIDRSFVARLGVCTSDSAIVRSILNLGREIGLQVVAEGIETESQRMQLLALDEVLGQGWLFAPGLSPDELIEQFGSCARAQGGRTRHSISMDEAARIAALRACKVLDTAPEDVYDHLTLLASELLSTPMALISLVDSDRQWFKAALGVNEKETEREIAFCNQAITQPDPIFVVADARSDTRFASNPLVVGAPHIRAYAGVVIRSREQLPLGTLCVLDTEPRTFSPEQLHQLSVLAEQVEMTLDLRRRAEDLNDLLRTRGRSLALDGIFTNDAVTPATRATQLASVDSGGVLATVGGDGARVIQCGGLIIDLSTHRTTLNGRSIEMTAKEAELLAHFAQHPGRTFSRSELLDDVWQSSPAWQSPATVTEHVYRLRSKLETDPTDPKILQTVRGVGYRLNVPAVTGWSPRVARGGTGIQMATRIVDADALPLFGALAPCAACGV